MLLAIVALPLLSAIVVGYFRNTWSKTMVSWVACGSIFSSFAMVLVLYVGYLGGQHQLNVMLWSMGPLAPEFGLLADGLSLWWMLVVTGCGFLIHLYSVGYMAEDASYGRFMAKMNYFIFAMSLLVLADNFMGLLMGWANVGLASYMLIGFNITKPAASAAALKAFIINMIGEVCMIAGIAFIYFHFGTLQYVDVFEAALAGHGYQAMNLIGILLLVGALAKSAQMPLHTWLPNAMEGPTPVSALIHAATMVTAGVYLVSRAWPIYESAATAAAMAAWLGALGALFGAMVAAGQNDIKRVLAFSTLSQVGYMFMANGLGAYVAADFHFLTHAFFKALLFLTAGIVIHHYHGEQDIRKMGGLWQKDRFASIVFLVGAAALIGVPYITSGFFSKDEILLAAYHNNMGLFVIGLVAAGLTAFYNVRLFSLVFLGNAWSPQIKALGKRQASSTHRARNQDHGHGHDAHHGTSAAMKWPVGILAVLSIVSGWIFFPHWQISFLEPAYLGLHLEHETINWVVAGLATTLAVLGGGLSWWLYGPKGIRRAAALDLNAKGGILLNMFYFDEFYDLIIVQPVKAVAGFVADVADTRLVDGTVNGLAGLAAGLGAQLRLIQSGRISRYSVLLFSGVIAMLFYFITYA